uniref:Uncharacterized protein n=1 Tax=Mandrillus leucophaeus TaxID=9568 RepID=A0A2K6AAX2_MANLE
MISEGGWGCQGWGQSQGLRPAPCSWVSCRVSPPSAIQETQLHFLVDTLPSPLSILLPPHKQRSCPRMLCPSPSVPSTRWGRPQWKLLNSVTGQSSDTVISQFSLAMSFHNFPVPQLRFLNTSSTDEAKKSSVNK